MGETPGKEEKAEVRTKENMILTFFVFFFNMDFVTFHMKFFSSSQTHGRARA